MARSWSANWCALSPPAPLAGSTPVAEPFTTKPPSVLRRISVVLGAAFLMATSAIGPGFLTQTVVFTERLGASFGFVILVGAIALALAAQAMRTRLTRT